MAYFKKNEPDETRRNNTVPPDAGYTQGYDSGAFQGNDFQPGYDIQSGYDDEYSDEYNDGFEDNLDEYANEELTEEEKQERRKTRFQLLFGAGDLTGIIIGTVVILLLLAFLFQMINFVRDDIHDFFDTVGRFFA